MCEHRLSIKYSIFIHPNHLRGATKSDFKTLHCKLSAKRICPVVKYVHPSTVVPRANSCNLTACVLCLQDQIVIPLTHTGLRGAGHDEDNPLLVVHPNYVVDE